MKCVLRVLPKFKNIWTPGKVKQGSYAGEEVTWEEAKRYAQQLDIDTAGGPDHEAAWKLAADMGISEHVREATEHYARWSAAAEYKALVAMGYSKQEAAGPECAAYRGRGRL